MNLRLDNEYRVIVCGGRDYGIIKYPSGKIEKNQEQISFLERKLDILHLAASANKKTLIIIQGEAKGADLMAKEWAIKRGVKTLDFKPDWDRYKKRAGFIRNSEMLKDGRPHLVVGFPGGTGTQMMCRIADEANVPVKRYF